MSVGARIHGQDSRGGIALIHMHFACGGKGNVFSRLCELLCGLFDAGADGITKVPAALLQRNFLSCNLVVGINGLPLGHGGVGFGNGCLLLLGSGNCFVQEGILLLIKET